MARMVVVMSLVLVFAGSGRVSASSGVEDDASIGCVQLMLDCYALAWEMDGYWDKLAAAVGCDLLFQRCVRLKILGV